MTIRAILFALPLMFLGWVVTLASISLLSDAAPASVVLFPSSKLLQNLPEGTAILASSNYSITLSAEHPNVARSLYEAGAYLVLPAGLTGCLPLPG